MSERVGTYRLLVDGYGVSEWATYEEAFSHWKQICEASPEPQWAKLQQLSWSSCGFFERRT